MNKKYVLSFILFILIYSVSIGQTNNRDKFLQVIEALFPHHEIDKVLTSEVVYTKVWDTHATIPVYSNDIAELEDGINAIALTIYISYNPDDYRIMKEKEFITMEDVDEDTEFTGGDQKLIQVVFYDFKNDTFIGKPEGFPLSGIAWLPEEFTIPLEMTFIESIETSPDCENTCILTIAEYSDMYPVKLYYVFKYHNGKILSSEPFRGSLESVYEKDHTIIAKFIEYDDYGEEIIFQDIILTY